MSKVTFNVKYVRGWRKWVLQVQEDGVEVFQKSMVSKAKAEKLGRLLVGNHELVEEVNSAP